MRISRDTRVLFEDVLGCKWTLGILDAMNSGIRRPAGIRRAMPGLTPKVMQQRFRKLEGWELIRRRPVALKPLHVEYHLTSRGRQLCRLLAGVERFADRWRSDTGGDIG